MLDGTTSETIQLKQSDVISFLEKDSLADAAACVLLESIWGESYYLHLKNREREDFGTVFTSFFLVMIIQRTLFDLVDSLNGFFEASNESFKHKIKLLLPSLRSAVHFVNKQWGLSHQTKPNSNSKIISSYFPPLKFSRIKYWYNLMKITR